MELFSGEAKAIQKQISDWIAHPEYELEATFGNEGRVDATTFLTVAKRLRAKGYTSLPQSDRMTIMTKDQVRFTLSSLGIIQQYCRDDVLAAKPFDAMIKDRATTTATVDLDEYGTHIKSRREIPMGHDDAAVKGLLEQWPRVAKAFRIIRRWTFETEGLLIEMSIVRSTTRDRHGQYKWQRKFRDQEIMGSAPIYEIEVELLRLKGDTPAIAMKRFIKGIGEVLRGIQKNTILIRTSTKKKVFDLYRAMTGTDKFRGPSMRTLQKKNFLAQHEEGEANIRDGYNVTDKADGLRCIGFCNSSGELFLIDMNMTSIYRTGLKQPECRESLVDGEWVTLNAKKEPIQQFLVFDIFYATDKKDVSQMPFQQQEAERPLESRHGQLTEWVARWNKGDGPAIVAAGVTATTKLQISMKEFRFGRAGDDSIFHAASRVLDTARIYYTDGLIFTPNKLPLPAAAATTFYEQFKWKPPQDNTVDFLVKMEKNKETRADKITVGIHPGTNETVAFKTLRLFVGSSTENSRNIILNKLELPKKNRLVRGADVIKGEYKPVLFTPREFPDTMASICNLPVENDPDTGETFIKTESDEPIQDSTIVEMAYDFKEAPGWRWKPLRVRMDKTERLQSGNLGRTLNSDRVAEDVWDSIYDPITKSMISTGNEQPSAAEQADLTGSTSGLGKVYYNRNAPKQDQMLTRTMRDFHNKYIKERILYQVGLGGGGKTLIDTACGVGADLQIWRRNKAAFVLGVDYSDENIRGDKDSIYRRYLESMVIGGGRDAAAPMVFVIGNSSKNYVSGDAGTTEEEKDVLRSLLGRSRPHGTLPPYIEQDVAGRLKTGADCMSCMAALHYFFETPQTFKGYMRNISDNLKVGGYFIGYCFDGDKVFDLLRGVRKGESKSGLNGDTTLWTITKKYDEDDMPEGEGSIGLAIDVNFITIGMTHTEYLVPFGFLKDSMKAIGCELLSPEELKKLKMVNNSATFDISWEMAKKMGNTYEMMPAIRQFSFLNRWFIFKRKGLGAAENSTGLESLRAAAQAATSVRESKEADEDAEVEVAAGPSAKPSKTASKIRTAVEERPVVPTVQTYSSGELFQFYPGAAERDVLEIGDKGAGQWLSPSAPFPIEDPEDSDVVYPSLEHYLAAMQYRVASDTPQLAASLFSVNGTIHQTFLRKRLLESETGKKPLADKRESELLKEEATSVRDAIRPAVFKRYTSTFDGAKWAANKEDILREGLRQRWEGDARFRKIVEAARDKGKTLLYYTPGANSSNMGGVRKNDGHIEGENKIGKIIMELAGF